MKKDRDFKEKERKLRKHEKPAGKSAAESKAKMKPYKKEGIRKWSWHDFEEDGV